ncbi:MAG TPA: hypothetical protein VLY46_12190 [Usitatibacter sp.]|nr:hypothetical protein [Usitatibacter sp.]
MMARTKETAHRPSQELEEELAGLGATPAVDARLHADGGTAAEIFREAFDRGADADQPPLSIRRVIEPRHHSPTCDA